MDPELNNILLQKILSEDNSRGPYSVDPPSISTYTNEIGRQKSSKLESISESENQTSNAAVGGIDSETDARPMQQVRFVLSEVIPSHDSTEPEPYPISESKSDRVNLIRAKLQESKQQRVFDQLNSSNNKSDSSVTDSSELKREYLTSKREENRASLKELTRLETGKVLRKSFVEDSSHRIYNIGQVLGNPDMGIRRQQTDDEKSQYTVDYPSPSELGAENIGKGLPIMDDVQKKVFIKVLEDEDDYSDCGNPGSQFTLSRRHSRNVRKAKHLGFFALDGRKHFYSFFSSFGNFNCPLDSCSRNAANNDDAFIQVGLGVSLYFKCMKALMLILLCMTLATLPSIILLSQTGLKTLTLSPFNTYIPSLEPLAITTIASIALPTFSCRKANEGDMFSFKCPRGQVLGEVTARYGQPAACVSLAYPNTGHTRLSDSGACSSATASYVATSVCDGTPACNFTVSATANFTLKPTIAMTTMNPALCLYGSTPGNCITTLSTGGTFSGCDGSKTQYLTFEAVCIGAISGNANTDDSIPRLALAQLVSVLNAIAISVFIIGVWCIRNTQEIEISDKESNSCRPSNYTVQMDVNSPYIDGFFSRDALINHFEQTLSFQPSVNQDGDVRVADINYSTNCYRYTQAAIQRGKYAGLIDKELARYVTSLKTSRMVQPRQKWKKSLTNLLYHFEIYNHKCQVLEADALTSIDRAYVTFDTEEGYLRCLRYFNSTSLHPSQQLEEMSVPQLSKTLHVHTTVNPTDLIWENFGISVTTRGIRIALTTVLLFIVLFLSYLSVYSMQHHINTANGMVPDCKCNTYDIDPNPSATTTRTSTITYSKSMADYTGRNYGYLRCYCANILTTTDFSSMINKFFTFLPASIQGYWCSDFYNAEYQKQMQYYYIAAIVLFFNMVLLYLIPKCVEFELWECREKTSVSLLLKSFVFQYINTGCLALIIYGNLNDLQHDDLSVTSAESNDFLLGAFAGPYRDFDVTWYPAIGVSLVFTMFAYPLGNRIVHGLSPLLLLFKRVFDERTGRCTSSLFTPSITHVTLQSELDEMYIGDEFPIELQFGSVLAAIAVCLTFSAGMPLLYAVCFICLLAIYFGDKLFLLRVNRAPKDLSLLVVRLATNLLYGAALLHCMFAIWMFGALDTQQTTALDRITNKNCVFHFSVFITLLALMLLAYPLTQLQ